MTRTKFLLATALVAPIALSATAQAADLPAPVYEPIAPIVAPVVAPFTWSGAYIGVTAGFGFLDEDDDEDDGFRDDHRFNVFGDDRHDDDDETNLVGGVLAGFNAQFGSFVVGYETDFVGTDIRTDDRTFRFERNRGFDKDLDRDLIDVAQFDGHAHMWWLATTRLRAGFAFNRFLVYGTGGLAFAHIDFDGRFREDQDVLGQGGFRDEGINGDDDVEIGWVIGAGVEGAITDNVTARVEYLFTDFDIDGEDDFGDAFNNDDNGDRGFEFQTHIVRAAVTAKFNFGGMFGR